MIPQNPTSEDELEPMPAGFRTLRPALAGMASATALVLVMWLLVGRLYEPKAFLRLFYGSLFPATVGAAFISGMVVALVKRRGHMFYAVAATVITAYLFSFLLTEFLFTIPLPHLPGAGWGAAIAFVLWSSVYVAFGVFFLAMPFVATSGIGAACGAVLKGKKVETQTRVLGVAFALVLGWLIVQGSLILSSLRTAEKNAPAAFRVVERNLVKIPPGVECRAYPDADDESVLPKQITLKCNVRYGSSIDIKLTGKDVRGAHLYIVVPGETKVKDHNTMAEALRSHDVRDEFIGSMHYVAHNDSWSGIRGIYSVTVSH